MDHNRVEDTVAFRDVLAARLDMALSGYFDNGARCGT